MNIVLRGATELALHAEENTRRHAKSNREPCANSTSPSHDSNANRRHEQPSTLRENGVPGSRLGSRTLPGQHKIRTRRHRHRESADWDVKARFTFARRTHSPSSRNLRTPEEVSRFRGESPTPRRPRNSRSADTFAYLASRRRSRPLDLRSRGHAMPFDSVRRSFGFWHDGYLTLHQRHNHEHSVSKRRHENKNKYGT
jgi:hypothetical protein